MVPTPFQFSNKPSMQLTAPTRPRIWFSLKSHDTTDAVSPLGMCQAAVSPLGMCEAAVTNLKPNSDP
jgi:hypothetical protein